MRASTEWLLQDGRFYADARGRKDLHSEGVEGMGLVGVAFAKIESDTDRPE